jgi:hypothetical protein
MTTGGGLIISRGTCHSAKLGDILLHFLVNHCCVFGSTRLELSSVEFRNEYGQYATNSSFGAEMHVGSQLVNCTSYRDVED